MNQKMPTPPKIKNDKRKQFVKMIWHPEEMDKLGKQEMA